MKRQRTLQQPCAYTWEVTERPAPPSPAPQTANAEQAALLLDVALRPLLGLLMQTPSTAREVAEHLNVKTQRAYYLLRKLASAGVAQVSVERGSGGQVCKQYAVSPRWFIPYEVTRAETLEAFLAGQILPRMERFVDHSVRLIQTQQPNWGYWLERSERSSNLRMGGPDGSAHTPFEGEEPFLLNLGTAHLTRAGAAELERRLRAVLAECEELEVPLEAPKADAYTIGLLLVRGEVG